MNIIRFWFKNARGIALPQSILPASLAVAMAATHSDFSWSLAILAVLGVLFVHLGMNLADDYFDYKLKGAEIRNKMYAEGMRARIGKCDYITSGETNIRNLFIAICVFLLLAAALGAVILYFRGLTILYITMAALLVGLSYSGAPLSLGYRGLGELVIGVMFGPLLMIGVQYAASGVLDNAILLVSVAVGSLVVNIVYAHSIMDAEPDKRVGKMTFARLLAVPWAMLLFVGIFNFFPFVSIVIGVLTGVLHWAYLSVFLVLPMACYMMYSMKCYVYNQPIELNVKFWMGPMSQWNEICKYDLQWFMIRWLVARNLVSFFCFILVLVNIILALVNA